MSCDSPRMQKPDSLTLLRQNVQAVESRLHHDVHVTKSLGQRGAYRLIKDTVPRVFVNPRTCPCQGCLHRTIFISNQVLPQQSDTMAELAAVGAAASIIQLLGFGNKSLICITQYLSTPGHNSPTLSNLKAQLGLLLYTLRSIHVKISVGVLGTRFGKALQPVLIACVDQIEALNAILTKLTPIPGASWKRRGWQATSNLYYEGRINAIRTEWQHHVQIWTLYHVSLAALPTSQELQEASHGQLDRRNIAKCTGALDEYVSTLSHDLLERGAQNCL